MRYNIITIGSSAMDIMFRTDKAQIIKSQGKELIAFDLGSKIDSKDVLYTTGGGAANTAVSLAKLGFKVAVLTAIGKGANGQIILNRFKQEGVAVNLIQKPNNYSTLSFVITGGKKNDRVIFVHRAAGDLLEVKQPALKRVKTDWYYVCSLSGKNWVKNLKNIFEVSQKKNIKVAWNPGSTQLNADYEVLKRFLKQTEVLLLNKAEAIKLVSSYGIKTTKVSELFKALYSLGPKIIAITHGAKGAYVYSGEAVCFEKALPIVGINTTGAGDAFGSSLVGGLILYKGDLKKALRLAIIRSNYVVRKIGAQEGLLTLRQVDKLRLKD